MWITKKDNREWASETTRTNLFIPCRFSSGNQQIGKNSVLFGHYHQYTPFTSEKRFFTSVVSDLEDEQSRQKKWWMHKINEERKKENCVVCVIPLMLYITFCSPGMPLSLLWQRPAELYEKQGCPYHEIESQFCVGIDVPLSGQLRSCVSAHKSLEQTAQSPK